MLLPLLLRPPLCNIPILRPITNLQDAHIETPMRYNTTRSPIVQKPKPADIANIVALVNSDGEHLIPRKKSEVRKKLAFWRIIKINRKVIACGCLERYSRRMAEIRSFIVHPDYRGRGYGEDILTELLTLALPNQKVFVVTSLPDFFKKYTFSECLQEKYILFYG